MLGSISKVRPVGQNHYYKYAHARGYADLFYVTRCYYEDVDDKGNFGPYTFPSVTTGGRGLFYYYYSSSTTRPEFKIKHYYVDLPNCTNFNIMFYDNKNLERATITTDWDNETFLSAASNIEQTFRGCKNIKEIPESIANSNIKSFPWTFRDQGWGILEIIDDKNAKYPFVPCFENATNLSADWYGIAASRPDGKYSYWYFDEKYTFENLKYGASMCLNVWPYMGTGIQKMSDNINFKNLISAESMFSGHGMYEFKSKEGLPSLTNGYRMLSTNTYFRSLTKFCKGVEDPLPKLSNGDLMFNGCTLDKESTLRILNSIPDWTGDSNNHKLTLGICMDCKYDPEVNYAIKAVDSSFTPVVELDELPTTSKNWKIAVQWNGIASDEEYFPDSFRECLDLDTIQLPEGYQRCLYLKSNNSGAQIDTGYIPTNDTGLYAMGMHWTGGNNIFGSGIFSNTNHNNALWVPNNRTRFYKKFLENVEGLRDVASQGDMYAAYAYMDKSYTFNDKSGRRSEGWLNWLNSRTAEMRTVEKSFSATLPTPTATKNHVSLRMFSSPSRTASGGMIYRAKISEGTEIVRDFIPALDPDGVPCMYELYEGKSYYNIYPDKPIEYEIYRV